MNVSRILAAAAILGLGGSSVYFYRQADAARGCAAAEAAARRNQESRLAELERIRAGQDSYIQALLNQRGGTVPSASSAPGTGHPAIALLSAQALSAQIPGSGAIFGGKADKLDPAVGNLMKAVSQISTRGMFGELVKELGLPKEQGEQLLKLLSEQQGREIDLMQQDANPTALADLKAKHDTELMALLGVKYPQYEEYSKTRAERMQVSRLGRHLEAAKMPLREDQRKQLVAIMSEENQSVPPPVWSKEAPQEEIVAKQRKWREDYNRRVQARAAGSLSPEQLKKFEEVSKGPVVQEFQIIGGETPLMFGN